MHLLALIPRLDGISIRVREEFVLLLVSVILFRFYADDRRFDHLIEFLQQCERILRPCQS